MKWCMFWFGFCCCSFLYQIAACATHGHGEEDKWLAVTGVGVVISLANLWMKDAKKR